MESNQPINNLIWVDRNKLTPNDYNPNYVAPQELKLLKKSILETGWTQPIVVDEKLVIIDGYHRYTVSKDPEISKMTSGKVPVVVVQKIDEGHRRIATIRHNRARGTHAVLDMASILQSLVEDQKLTKEEIKYRLGMDDEEVDRLLTRKGMPGIMSSEQKGFNRSWKPNRKST